MQRLTAAMVVVLVLSAAVAFWCVSHDMPAGACTAEAAARTVLLWRAAIFVQLFLVGACVAQVVRS